MKTENDANIENHPIVDSDEQLFAFGSFEAKINGRLFFAPVIEAGDPDGDLGEFCDEFDAKVIEKLDVRGSSSEISGVETEAKNMLKFSSEARGVITETSAKQTVRQMMHLDPQCKQSKRKKEAARQACTIAKEIGWDDVIPDEENRHWYKLN
jgi:hypothetical protein